MIKKLVLSFGKNNNDALYDKMKIVIEQQEKLQPTRFAWQQKFKKNNYSDTLGKANLQRNGWIE